MQGTVADSGVTVVDHTDSFAFREKSLEGNTPKSKSLKVPTSG